MTDVAVPAPAERGWGSLLLALAVFLFLPHVPPINALLPVEDTLLLLLPAIAACCLVGWWAGGRFVLAVVWVGLALYVVRLPSAPGSFYNLVRGWSLLVAGAFGLVCLLLPTRPFFPRALTTLGLALGLVLILSVSGPLSASRLRSSVTVELARRNTQTLTAFRSFGTEHPEAVKNMPQMNVMLDEFEARSREVASSGSVVFPSLLLLESLVALALGWATYHRIARSRLGAPLGVLRDFRFNDQFVWGLIAGLTIVFVPTMGFLDMAGRNLLLFFGALYAVRGLGVLSWFLAPGALAAALFAGFCMLFWPVLNLVAVTGFLLLALAAFGLGLGDTWADWRRRARPTT